MGNGENINVWEDPWIPSSPSRKLISSRGNIVITRVSDLIDPVTRAWDEPLLRSLFLSIDVQRILKIPLAIGMMEDFVSWNYTKTGIFTVRSAYYTEWDHQHGRKLLRTNGQGTAEINPVWSKVWSMKVSAKVKIFSWRFLHEAIPCKCTLANRHIINSSLCPVCSIYCEDMLHAFFQCPMIQEIWENLGLNEMINEMSTVDRSGSAVFEALL